MIATVGTTRRSLGRERKSLDSVIISATGGAARQKSRRAPRPAAASAVSAYAVIRVSARVVCPTFVREGARPATTARSGRVPNARCTVPSMSSTATSKPKPWWLLRARVAHLLVGHAWLRSVGSRVCLTNVHHHESDRVPVRAMQVEQPPPRTLGDRAGQGSEDEQDGTAVRGGTFAAEAASVSCRQVDVAILSPARRSPPEAAISRQATSGRSLRLVPLRSERSRILKSCRQIARLRQRCASREVLPSAILRAT